MNALVIYDSAYGNTEKIARAIADTLKTKALLVKDANREEFNKVNLLIVGSPTQGGRPTEALKNYLDDLPDNFLAEMSVAAFDTRFDERKQNVALKMVMKTIGYAAPKIAKELHKKGGSIVGRPEGFIVTNREGPLLSGELERATNWAKAIADTVNFTQLT